MAEHEGYLEEKRDKWLVFVGDGRENGGEMLYKPYTHRWTEQYIRRTYARMNDFVRGAREEYDDPYLAILPAFTASTVTPAGRYRSPIDHFRSLKQSWSRGVRYELHHSMEADRKKDCYPSRDWEYLQVWEPTTDAGYTEGGYAHLHPVVVCDGKVGVERFRSVMEKHVEKCDLAAAEAHDVNEIDIRPLDDLANPAAYLFKYLSKSWDPEDAAPYQRRFDALLHETDYRRMQPSDGAQRWMQRDSDGPTEPWLFAGIGDGEDVEELRTYRDAEEFQVKHEMGVGAWLSAYEEPVSVQLDEERGAPREESYVDVDETERCNHPVWSPHRCVSCGIVRSELVRGEPPPGS